MAGDMETLEVFTKGLRNFIHRKDWTQAKLAAELGFKAQGSVSAVVTGGSQLNYCQLVRLLDLGMSFEEMFGKERTRKGSPEYAELVREVARDAVILVIRDLLTKGPRPGGAAGQQGA